MPPKASKKAGNATEKSKTASEDQRVEILQALVITDDFTSTFTPLTLTTPRCLLPLASTPLLHYTLTFLAQAGVEKVFLLCPANHAAQIESYLQTSKWTSPTSPFTLKMLRSQGKSVGDVMRDVDQQGALVGDFLCVYGDLVANFNLTAALQAHKATRAKSKNAIMTMVLRQGGQRSQSVKTKPVFVLDDTTHRCLHYETLSPSQPHARLQLDSDILSDFPELDIRADLIDCGIDICSPEVLSQWSDNFDWQHPRKGFLYGTLKDFELNGMTVHAHIVDEGYTARVRSLAAYDAVSRDVVGRWTYPFCPDGNLVEDQSFVLGKGGNYREEGVALARSVVVKRRSVLGKGTAVGHGSIITDSVIGRRCHIGRRVRLEGAYVWDDAWIGDGTVIEKAVVANEVSVGHDCKILPGAVLAQSTVIANGTTIHGTQRITRHKRKREQGNEEVVRGTTDTAVVGQGGEGFDLSPSSDDEDFESLIPALSSLDTADTASISTLDSEADDSDSDLSALDTHARRSSRTESFGSIGSVNSEETAGEAEARRNAADFHHEAASSVFDSLQRGEDADNIQLELKALTLSSNADGKQVRRAVAVALMKRIASLVESGISPQKAVSQTLKPAKLLVERAVLDRDNAVKAETVEFLLFVQGDLVHRAQGGKVLLFVCNALVAGGSVESEGLDQWLEDERSGATEELVRVRQETMDIVGEDSSEEDSEEESEDDTDQIIPLSTTTTIYSNSTKPRLSPSPSGDSNTNSATTPPVTRATKRKLDSSTADLDPQQPRRKASKTATASSGATKVKIVGDSSDLPTTPLSVSELGTMDSDMEDAASLASSADFGEAEGSSLGGDDSDVEIDDDFGDDDAFQTHEKDLRAKRKAFEVEYNVYSPEDIQAQQDRQIDEVAGLLEQPKESTAILLRYMRWNKERLIEQYMDKQEEMLDKAGLSEGMKSSPPRIEVKNDFMCEICCENGPGLQTFAMKCGHRFCVDCYRHYLSQKIQEEGEAARIKCPGDSCSRIVDTKSLDLLVTADLTDRYHQLLMRTYVDDKENLKWCPAPNCVFAVECGVKKRELGQIVPT
ncbi:translation initiation factor eIF-2B epsilon subunit, GEF, partial [Oleoguttula sp. CCFEE 5521]